MITATTPEHIAYYRLCSLKQQLKLESIGLKSSGGPIRPRIAAEFGLSPRAKHAQFIATIQEKMDEMLAAKAAREAA